MADGQVALITGGASGLGRALGEALAKRGARVVLADRQLDAAESVAQSIRRDGGQATATALDVRDLVAYGRVVQEVLSRHSRIDLFLNNAGIMVGGPIERYEASDWSDVFDVNILGVTNGIQSVYPVMRSQGHGHIVNTASMAGLVAVGTLGSYCASKHAVVGLSKSLRIEARRHGVSVSVLCPGFIQTPILKGGVFGRMRIPGLTEQRMNTLIAAIKPMDVTRFAQQAVRAIARKEAIIVLPRWWKAVWALDRLSPRVSSLLANAIYDRMVHDMDEWANDVAAPVAAGANGHRGPSSTRSLS